MLELNFLDKKDIKRYKKRLINLSRLKILRFCIIKDINKIER